MATQPGSDRRPPSRRADGARRRFFISLLITAVLLEGGLRLLLGNDAAPELVKRSRDPDVCVEPILGADGVYTGRLEKLPRTNIAVDGRGARKREGLAPTNALRIVTVGDAWTFGLGVEAGQTWGAVAEAALRHRRMRVEVVNMAVPWQATPQQVAWLARSAAELDPDVVLLGVSPDDLTPRDSWCVDGQRLNTPGRWLTRRLRIARIASALVQRLGPPSLPAAAQTAAGSPDERFRVAVERFDGLTRTEGFLGAVVLLTDREAFSEVADCPGCSAAHDLLEEGSARRIDLTPAYRALKADPNGLLPGHEGTPSVVGHEFLGRQLADALLDWDELRARLGP